MEKIRSMTGFGRCEAGGHNRKFSVEFKAVNHRYLETNIKLPRKLGVFESKIRSLMKRYIERGKVDVYVQLEDFNESQETVHYNSAIAKEYYGYLTQMAKEFGLENDIRLSTLSRYQDVFTMEEAEENEDEIWEDLEECVKGALERFVEAREEEGENLKKDLLEKLESMKEDVDFIERRSPQIVEEYRRKITERVNEILASSGVQAEESRLLTEVAIFADKVCVDEEIVRLKSHIDSMIQCLKAGGGCGRKLDFIAQEMNREANTTLSKSSDLELSDRAIELKTVIEKIREQVQNIE
ncbi:MAG: YicC family protein [Lachnospiraceae bacterium]|nr:YicC family protein [Lachnospiraceae bacterium]